MIDPLSVPAIAAFLAALNTGVATEAARAVSDGVAELLRRCAGRPMPHPRTDQEVHEAAQLLYAASVDQAAFAAALRVLIQLLAQAPCPALVPRESPPIDSSIFLDRKAVHKALDAEYRRAFNGRPRAVNPFGDAGAGVTSAIANWVARHKEEFTDGHIYLDLREGRGTSAGLRPVTVLQEVLRRLGWAVDELAAKQSFLAAAYRTAVTGRRLLVVLDGVHAPTQIRDLLVAEKGVFTILLSRHALVGRCAHVQVGPLPRRHSRALLRQVRPPGSPRTARAAERQQLARCAGSPWAITVIGAALQEAPADPAGRDAGADLSIGVLDAVYQGLDSAGARAYRLLGLRGWAEITSELAAAILQPVNAEQAAVLLDELHRRHLLTRLPGDAPRYRFRDHVQDHARRVAERTDRRENALRRAARHLVALAAAADFYAFPDRWRLGPWYEVPERNAKEGVPDYPSKEEALRALRKLSGNVIEAVYASCGIGDSEVAAYLCQSLWPLQLNAGLIAEVAAALAVVLPLADQDFPGTQLAARVHVQYALGQHTLGHTADAENHLRTALAYDEQCGHLRGQATALESLALIRSADPLTHAEALTLIDQARQAAEQITDSLPGWDDNDRRLALLTRHRGWALRSTDVAAARWQLEQSVADFLGLQHGPDKINAGKALTQIAATYIDAGAPEDAVPYLHRAVELLQGQAAPEHLTLAEQCLVVCLGVLSEPGPR